MKIHTPVVKLLLQFFHQEGVTYAILLMNAAAWLLDQYLVPRRFGAGKEGAQ